MKIFKSAALLFIVILAAFTPFNANADITDILKKGSKVGDTLGNLVEGVLTKTDIQVADMAGQWTAQGSAVSFKGDNFLEKAGGVAAAATIESQLNPYFKQYGLTGGTVTIKEDGSFTMKFKNISLSGTITKNEDKTFYFNFKALGKINIGKIKTYVEKGPQSLDIMFDASKLKQLVSTIAGFSGNTLAKTAGKLLDSYEGMCVGFKLDKTGSASQNATTSGTSTKGSAKESTQKASDKIKQGAEALKGMISGSSSSSKK